MTKVISHLRRHRRRADLSQEELAHLLGSQPVNVASQHEEIIDESGLRTAIALEVIFRASLHELFPAMYEGIEGGVIRRANKLLRRAGGTMSEDKMRTLMAIVDPPFEDLSFEPLTRA